LKELEINPESKVKKATSELEEDCRMWTIMHAFKKTFEDFNQSISEYWLKPVDPLSLQIDISIREKVKNMMDKNEFTSSQAKVDKILELTKD